VEKKKENLKFGGGKVKKKVRVKNLIKIG
jgi:hypothetical protein